MVGFKHTLCALLLTMVTGMAIAQNNTNSPSKINVNESMAVYEAGFSGLICAPSRSPKAIPPIALLLPKLWSDTETAIRAGVMKGMEYEISGYIESMKHKYPELLVFLTGGDDFSFDSSVKSIIFADRFLVLKGLNRILNYNNGRI